MRAAGQHNTTEHSTPHSNPGLRFKVALLTRADIRSVYRVGSLRMSGQLPLKGVLPEVQYTCPLIYPSHGTKSKWTQISLMQISLKSSLFKICSHTDHKASVQSTVPIGV